MPNLVDFYLNLVLVKKWDDLEPCFRVIQIERPSDVFWEGDTYTVSYAQRCFFVFFLQSERFKFSQCF